MTSSSSSSMVSSENDSIVSTSSSQQEYVSMVHFQQEETNAPMALENASDSSQHEDEDEKKIMMVMRWLKHLRHRYIRLENGIFNCKFCKLHFLDTDSLIVHMLEERHVNMVISAKKSVLKEKERWPFLDDILLFDFDSTEDFTEPENAFLDEMVDYRMETLRCIVDNDRLKIQPYYYGAAKKEKENHVHVYNHQVYESLGKIKISLRCNLSYYLDCYSEYVKANKFDFIHTIWAEWKGVEGGNQVAEEDAGNAKFVDPLEVSMVVMPYRRNLGIVRGSKNDTDEPKLCFICDEEMIYGKDVASLLAFLDPCTEHPGTTHVIKCCNLKQVLARKRRMGPVETHDGTIMQPTVWEEFHTFHLSCLVQWILWNQRVVICDDIEDEIKVKLDEIICPSCCTNSKGKAIYSDSQVCFAFVA